MDNWKSQSTGDFKEVVKNRKPVAKDLRPVFCSFVGRVDVNTGMFAYSNASHKPPLLNCLEFGAYNDLDVNSHGNNQEVSIAAIHFSTGKSVSADHSQKEPS